jgi:hypothetical protein
MFGDSTVVPAMAARIERNGYGASNGICVSIATAMAQ